MKKEMLILSVWVTWCCVRLVPAQQGPAVLQWHTDLAVAQKRALEQKRDLLICFQDPNRDLKESLLDTPVFQHYVKRFVPVLIGSVSPSDQTLRSRFAGDYGLTAQPVVFLADREGSPYGRVEYKGQSADDFVESLRFVQKAKPMIDPGALWIEQYDVAQAKAESLGKDLLINFTGSDWCIWCQRLEREIFVKPEFKREIVKDFVLVKLDFPQKKAQSREIAKQNFELKKTFERRYGQIGYPTLFLTDPNDGPYSRGGYIRDMTPEAFARSLRDSKAKHDAEKASSNQQDEPQDPPQGTGEI